MSINIGPPSVDELRPRIAVIGVGGAGGNAIANMIAASVEGVDFVVANTDAQALNSSTAEQRIQLGPEITQGLGAGSRPEVGRAAAEETVKDIEAALEGAHMCFIAAGMGGGTGTGAAPVIAKIARDRGILTVGVVTKPFTFEGTRRMRAADAGIDELQKNVDTLIVIPNQNLFLIANPNTTFKEAFQLADEVLQQGVRSITDLMVMPGLINLDFADVRSVMREMGKAMMGTGEADGDGRALEAAEKAIANPLLDGVSMKGAKGVIVSITGGEDMRLMEVDEAANHIRELVDPDANIIWGSAFNADLEGKIRVSVVATGIEGDGLGDRSSESRPYSLQSQPIAPVAVAKTQDPGTAMAAQPLADIGERVAADMAVAPQPHDSDTADAPLELNDAATGKPGDMDDELVLDASSMAHHDNADAPSKPVIDDDIDDAPGDKGASSKADAHAPSVSGSDSGSDSGSGSGANSGDADKPKAPRVASSSGGTLFERMSNLSRGASSRNDEDIDDDDDGAPLNIPRFLGRQNNQ